MMIGSDTMKFRNLILIIFLSVIIVSPSSAWEFEEPRTYSGGDSPYNRGGYSPEGMDGVIRGDGVYMTPAPGRDTYYGEDIYEQEQEEYEGSLDSDLDQNW